MQAMSTGVASQILNLDTRRRQMTKFTQRYSYRRRGYQRGGTSPKILVGEPDVKSALG